MRRFLMAMVFAIVLTGCSRIPGLPFEDGLDKMNESFESDIQIQSGELYAAARLIRVPEGFTMTFTHPDTLRGMEMVMAEGGLDIRYRGLDFTFSSAMAPRGSIPRLTSNVISSLLQREGITSRDLGDNTLLADGRIGADAFTAKLDNQTGAIIKLSIPSRNLEISFDNFMFIE